MSTPLTGIPERQAAGSAWAPLRTVAYRALWLAQLGSLVGTWMQTVGAQWLLVEGPDAASLVPLVQTASMLPVVIFALPAGVIADSFDRRRYLIVVHIALFATAVALAALTAFGSMPPLLLLAFTFALGAGSALTMPAWMAVIPDLVPRDLLPSASALGAISMNLARAIGPAIAGILIAQVSVAAVFGLNAVSYAVMAVAVAVWGPRRSRSNDAPERFPAALRAGVRYARHSLVVRRIMLRSALYVIPGAALWALLPLVANQRLGLGASGYGVLLGALGVGAISGAVVLPKLRSLLTTSQLVVGASVVYAGAMLVVALVQQAVVVGVVMLPAGAAWLAVLSSMGASMQMFLPTWVRARGLSIYQVVFLGGQGIAAVGWGLLAEELGLVVTFLAAAAVMALGGATVVVWPLHDTRNMDRSTVRYWSDPELAFEHDRDEGPILITIVYRVSAERVAEFHEAMEVVGRSRRRTGASRWRLYQDGAEPDRFVEMFLVPSWEEHLRQHTDRMTGTDQAIEERAIALADEPPVTAHLFPARPDR